MKSAKALPRYGSGHKSDGRTDSRTTPKQYPSASGLWRGIYTHTKFQLNPPKHFQDMAPDTKVPIPRYGSGHKSDGRTDSRTDSRTTPKQYPSASGGEYILIPNMAPDTKVPIIWLRTQTCRADGRTSDGRTDGRTAGRTDNAKTISLRL
ncbi:hypothetical protein DPMN_133754 [Dreissena polymorpha]|uniref:Uncharacterized protein n=1 Tax=Dreissena polymorpha TaxID=45954 RepID=A0A9D4FYH8_DREPO|nr:hypothetical protein DPMN_133754 [Dreissena polymorpha]